MSFKLALLATMTMISATSWARSKEVQDGPTCTMKNILRSALKAEDTFNAEKGEMFEGSEKVKVWNDDTRATVPSLGNANIDWALSKIGYNIGSSQPGYNSCALVASNILRNAGCDIKVTQDVNNLVKQALNDPDKWESSYFRKPGCLVVWYSRRTSSSGYPVLNGNGNTVMLDEKGHEVSDEDIPQARREGKKLKAKLVKARHIGIAYLGTNSIENTSWKSRVEIVNIGNLQKTFAYGNPTLYICPRQ